MATSWKGRVLANMGKQAVAQIWKQPSVVSSSSALTSTMITCRRGVHTSVDDSVYEKNMDDQAPPQVVQNEQVLESEEYWVPHPQTGVFVPPSDQDVTANGDSSPFKNGVQDSVLEQQAFIRPTSIEDLEKPIGLDPLKAE